METEPSSALTRPSLIARLRNEQDAEAWGTFVSVYARLVHGTCRRRGLQEADAADVTQAILAEVLRSMRSGFKYQPERGRFRDWLGTVTFRQIGRFLRQRAAQHAVANDCDLFEAPDPGWSADFQAHLMRLGLERIQADFEPLTWRVFVRVWFDNQPALAIAAEQNVTIDVVYTAKSRVLKRLREEIMHLADDVPQLGF